MSASFKAKTSRTPYAFAGINLAGHPVLNAICRLKSGIPMKSDFSDFLSLLREWSAHADQEAIYTPGQPGDVAKGVAQAYREIIATIENAAPSADYTISGSPDLTRDPTGLESTSGEPTPPP